MSSNMAHGFQTVHGTPSSQAQRGYKTVSSSKEVLLLRGTAISAAYDACRYGGPRDAYGGNLTVRARPGRGEDEYEGDDWDGDGYGRQQDYGRKRGRRESPTAHGRSRRHRYLCAAVLML